MGACVCSFPWRMTPSSVFPRRFTGDARPDEGHPVPRIPIVLATRNTGKVAELNALLQPFEVDVKGLDAFPQIGEIPEEGATFCENAAFKATTVANATGMIAVADDSGLVVDALAGAPGVYSARYAGASDSREEMSQDARNNAKLMRALEGVPRERRTARFVCCMAAAAPGGALLTTTGEWEGRITEVPAGGAGFGYDPLFFDPDVGRTAAEMGKDEKNARSHRARAIQALLERWPAFAAEASRRRI